MDWAVTSPPAKATAEVKGSYLDVLAIRVPCGDDVDPDYVRTEFLVADYNRQPEWVPDKEIEGVTVERVGPR
jgi:hypothetical protein